jgi:hypothetical protein
MTTGQPRPRQGKVKSKKAKVKKTNNLKIPLPQLAQ